MSYTFIEILGVKFGVGTAEPFSSSLTDISNGTAYNGKCNYNTQQILIQSGMSEHLTKSTLRHEIAHAVIRICCLDKENYTEENICEIIGMHGATIARLADEAYNALKGERE